MKSTNFLLYRIVLTLICLISVYILYTEKTPADVGTYKAIAHSNQDTGAQRDWGVGEPNDDSDTGVCRNCHNTHDSLNQTSGVAGNVDMLFAANNNVCLNAACHSDTVAVQPAWPGSAKYNLSSHATSASMLWPGANPPARALGEEGDCINCHNPHGRRVVDADNLTGGPYNFTADSVVPNMLTRQEEYLCYTCHDATGPATKDIKQYFTTWANASPTFYDHPINRDTILDDRTPYYHQSNDGSALTAANRHVECTDCHNPHYAKSGLHTQGDSIAGNVLLGTYGVSHGAWPAAPAPPTLPAAPAFTKKQFQDSTKNYEYELCLRCHSSYSTLPVYAAPNNVTDVSREINPNNLAIHPVAGRGKLVTSANFSDATFATGWDSGSYVTCSDCHSYKSGAFDADGPHGSVLKYIVDDTGGASAEDQVLCFKCHDYGVYNSGNAGSRVTHPFNGNHVNNAKNVWGIWCMSCHGGGTAGGIHGTNDGVGTSGVDNLGEHFMNGAAIIGFTYNAGGGNFSCWSKAGADVVNSCTRGHNPRNQGYNYLY